MKRGQPPQRKTPLESKTGLRRTGSLRPSELKSLAKWLARSSKAGRRNKPLGYRVRDTGPDRETRALVLERDEHRCQACGSTKDLQLHHRRPRQRGGDRSPEANLPSNLIVLCAVSHDHVERNRAEAYANGWLAHRGEDPATKPVETIRGWVLLTPDGRALEAASGSDGGEVQ